MGERGGPGKRWPPALRRDPEAEVDDELAFHIEERVREYVARGMDPEAARAAALERLGTLEGVREECVELLAAERRREARRERLIFSWLDLKLGLRLLRRYPGLTLVGGLAMAFAIAVGAATFEVVKQMIDPTLPLPDGDRIVALRHVDTRYTEATRPSSADFLSWREELRRVEEVGAFRTVQRNLDVPGGETRPVVVAEISASAFRVARTPPLEGRTLGDADEEPGAPAVAVVGHDLWRDRFGADPEVVGRVVRLRGVETTVVGVMPEGFAFPVAHGLWVPLRTSASGARADAGGFGGSLHVFGRLARGASLRGARAEIETLGARAAAAFPQTHGHLRPEIVPFARDVIPLDVPHGMEPLVYAVNLFFVMLLVVVCANVALLMFARAVSREGEIVVRSALGASRGRIVGQLFAEALVLGALAAVVGLAVAKFAIEAWLQVLELEMQGGVPFWFDADIGPATVVYTAALTVLGAAVAGVIPALRMTGAGVGGHLRRLTAGAAGPRLGRTWSAVIAAQVALTVAFPSATFFVHRYVAGMQELDPGFPSEEYLSARLDLDPIEEEEPPAEPGETRLPALAQELADRLAAEPGVRATTFTSRLPRTVHPRLWVELDEGPVESPPSNRGHPAVVARVAPDYFDALGAPPRVGRSFRPADGDVDAGVGAPGPVLVNASFVQHVLGGRNAVGRRLRYEGDAPQPWYEIVGVVEDLGSVSDDPHNLSGIYHPLPSDAAPGYLAVHLSGEPETFAPRLREIAAGVDPALRLAEVVPLDEVGATLWLEFQFLFRILAGLSAMALLLSLAAIYASTAFAVTRRRREIGIRIALGADARRVALGVFSRPVAQVGAGVLAGGGLTALLAWASMRGALWPVGAAWVALYAVLMMGVCLLACLVPTRRALAVEPAEALRADA